MNKIALGQFFTKNSVWLTSEIKEFIVDNNNKIAFDPFAGGGDLLNLAKELGFKNVKGYDIDKTLNWEYNDSLLNIPHLDNGFIITNPPYLGKSSAKRKKIPNIDLYFGKSKHDDFYKIGVEQIFNGAKSGVIIIPETFIQSSLIKEKHIRNRIKSISIIEDNPFNDTECPICIVCFDNIIKTDSDINIYVNGTLKFTLEYLENKRYSPKNNVSINFNDKNGQLALIGIDMTDDIKKIRFLNVKELKYDLNKIKVSSRAISVINIEGLNYNLDELVINLNKRLELYRLETADLLMSPFKGNTKSGKRRRRIDFKTVRSLIELSLQELGTI